MQTATGYTVERLDTGQTCRAGSRDISYYFAGCNDVSTFIAGNVAEARARAELAWYVDRAVRLFVILLDPQEEADDLAEVGEALDELLDYARVTELVENQIYSAPLPQPIDVLRVLGALSKAPLTAKLLDRYLMHQSAIARVRATFDQIDDSLFESTQYRQRFLEEAIDRGSMRSLVLAAYTAGKTNGALFQVYSDLRGLENYREIIQQWTASFERVHHDFEIKSEPEDQIEAVGHDPVSGGRKAFERAIHQQAAIVERIRAADFETARRYARELVTEQRRTSSPEHIAKSLSSISQRAKQFDVIDLALDWAQQAVEEKPDDAIAHAQLADLLMRVGRYTEASQSLDLAQSFGQGAYAASGRARILRYQGQYTAALEAYRKAYAQAGGEDRKHFDLAGIAECLRDMEKFAAALVAYDDAIVQFPHEAVLHAGRAATLVDLAQYDEALEGYQRALNLDDYNVVPRNGIASLYRRSGDFKYAEAQYREIISDYPFDVHARGGLVGTLREQGKLDEAIKEAEDLVRLVPASPDAMWILADTQIDARDFDSAVQTIEAAIEDHRHIAGLRTGLARVEKAKGNYAKALALYDDAHREFPSNASIQLARADMLRRLGNVDEALKIYERSLRRHPHRLPLKNALASIYIHQQRFDEALALLSVNDPRNADEWRNFALHGMLDVATGYIEHAQDRLSWGIEHCPFRRERNMLRAALSRLQIREGAAAKAIATAQECTDDLTELVKFHASATLADKGPARALYARLIRSYLPEPYHELRDEIAANYNVVAVPARRNLDWVLTREEDVLLLEAA